MVYVNLVYGVVIVKLFVNSDYGIIDDESSYREFEIFELFWVIVDVVKQIEEGLIFCFVFLLGFKIGLGIEVVVLIGLCF